MPLSLAESDRRQTFKSSQKDGRAAAWSKALMGLVSFSALKG
ncbi:hypothetical protein [Streptosporangium canum]|nr:hypothetical protein [Streptosporangium canum]